MLARIAESLYWTGRYIERSEHLARFLRVQYFSLQDAPESMNRRQTLQRVLEMYGMIKPEEKSMKEDDFLYQVAMDYSSELSLRSTIRAGRENARALRHVISTELWESINAFYLYSNGYDPKYFVSHGLYEYTMKVGENCAIIRSRIDDTLLQDQSWVLLKLGIHFERTLQILRILNNKLLDIFDLATKGANTPLRQFQGTIILKALEGFDMHRKHYREILTPDSTVAFLIAHPQFARSAAYNMMAVEKLLHRMDGFSSTRNPALFEAGKLHCYFRYLTYDDISDDMVGHLSKAMARVQALHQLIEDLYWGKK